MKSIEEIKIELTLKKLSGRLNEYEDTKILPKNDDLRTFVCSLGPGCSYYYALWVDCGPHDETRKSCCENSYFAYWYAYDVDGHARPDTREAAYRYLDHKNWYIMDLGE